MDYSLLTEQQLQKRYYFLPEKLKDVLDSENTLESVRQICRAHHLNDDEKIMIVEQLVGLVLLGFLSPDDLNLEISGNLHLNKKHSDDIVSEINRKIFAPIRSDLEKIYAPPVSEAERPVVSEIKKPEIRPAFADLPAGKAGAPAGKPPIEIIEEKKSKTETPAEAPKIITPPTEGPLMIHEEVKFKPLAETKKSLGGLFEFLRKKGEGKEEKVGPVRAQVEMGKQARIGIEKVEDKEKKVGPIEIRPPENLPIKIKIEPVITIQELQPPKEEPLKTKKSIIGLLGFLRKKGGEKEKETSPAKTPVETGKQMETTAIVEKETTPTPAPKIIIEKLEPKSVPKIKQPLGGFLLKFLTRKKEVVKEMKPLSLEVAEQGKREKVIPPEPPAVSTSAPSSVPRGRVEPPKVRVVNYTELLTSITPIEIKPPENFPKETKPLGTEIQPSKVEEKIPAEPLDVYVAPLKKEESRDKKESEEEIIDLSTFK